MNKKIQKYEVLYNHNTLLETRSFVNKDEFIYTISLVPEEIRERSRCIGFFMRYSNILHFIEKSTAKGLDEAGFYKYLVVEKFNEGIYAVSDEFEESWFESDLKNNKWKQIKKPSQFKGVINFGIG